MDEITYGRVPEKMKIFMGWRILYSERDKICEKLDQAFKYNKSFG